MIEPNSNWFGIELMIWICQNGSAEILSEFEIDDPEGFILAEMVKWDGGVRRNGRRFVDLWTKRFAKKTKAATANWQSGVRYYF